MARAYDNSRRSQQAAETAQRIVQTAEVLLATTPVADVTLQAIADAADTTVQTVLRHMGSRDGVFEAVGAQLVERVNAHRGRSAPGKVDEALDGLLQHYEADGLLVLNLLSQAIGGDAQAQGYAAEGRAYHRAWVERCFGPTTVEATDALVAATDLYVWRLLRLDLGRSAQATRAVMERLVRAILESP